MSCKYVFPISLIRYVCVCMCVYKHKNTNTCKHTLFFTILLSPSFYGNFLYINLYLFSLMSSLFSKSIHLFSAMYLLLHFECKALLIWYVYEYVHSLENKKIDVLVSWLSATSCQCPYKTLDGFLSLILRTTFSKSSIFMNSP